MKGLARIMAACAVLVVGGCSHCNILSSSPSNSWACAPLLAVAIVALPARPFTDTYARHDFKSKRPVWRLDAARRVDILDLPAGAVLYLYLNAPEDRTSVTSKNIDEIEWAGRPKLFGITLKAGMKREEYEQTYWLVQLSENQLIAGWPCARGDASIWNNGTLRGCRLSSTHPVMGHLASKTGTTQYLLPKGTRVLVFGDAMEFNAKGHESIRIELNSQG